jgi:crossover junction endodeoxyribonuclease RuvC
MMKTIIGIDPGVSGALAVITPEGNLGIYDLPTAPTENFNGIDPVELKRLLAMRIAPVFRNTVAYCEKSILPPKNGALATRSVYDCRGVIRAVLALSGIPLIYVSPKEWKKFHGLPEKSDKERSRGFCKQIRPDLSEQLARKMDHNRAEAVLIALYGQHREK